MEISLRLENLYCKSSIKPPGVSVLQKELECEVKKLTKYKKFQVMQPRIRIKSELLVGK